MKAKFNAEFKIDNKIYPPGVQDVTPAVFDIASKLDISGLPLLANSNQDPLCVKAESESAPVQK